MSDPTEAAKFKPSAHASPGSLTRRAFDALSAADRVRAVSEGWRVIDGPPEPKPIVISRADFDRLPPAGQAAFTQRGGMVAPAPGEADQQ